MGFSRAWALGAFFFISGAWAGVKPLPIGEKPVYPVQPIFEGLYAIKISCPPNPVDCRAQDLKRIDRLSVINSRLNTGTWITISASQHRDHVDRYLESDVNPEGDFISANPTSRFGTMGRFSYIEMKFNAADGSFAGKIMVGDALDDYVLHGTPIETAGQFQKARPPAVVAAEDVIGIYEGYLGTLKGKLIVKQLPDKHMIANFDSDEEAMGMPILRRPFFSGDWDPESGVLYLTFNLPNLSGQGMMAVAFRSYERGKIVFEGFETAGAVNNRVKFTMVRSRR